MYGFGKHTIQFVDTQEELINATGVTAGAIAKDDEFVIALLRTLIYSDGKLSGYAYVEIRDGHYYLHGDFVSDKKCPFAAMRIIKFMKEILDVKTIRFVLQPKAKALAKLLQKRGNRIVEFDNLFYSEV